jgi:predicted ATPase
MKIKSLQLKNFKRFTDLTLQDIPESAKLVLLIGSNGSGKSSVFDAFGLFNRFGHRERIHQQDVYYSKNTQPFQVLITLQDGTILDTETAYSRRSRLPRFYGRTSFRQVHSLTRSALGEAFDVRNDADRPRRFIDRDERFENDLEHLLNQLLREFFKIGDSNSIKLKVLDPLNGAFKRIFSLDSNNTLELVELIPPLEGNFAQINFRKGDSTFHYNQLSAGEKEVFNILINLIARGEYNRDTIYFYDEIDLHLNTQLQFNFLRELTENWIPQDSQFWTASHSLGFIEYAKQSENAIILDFNDLNFDYPKILSPVPKDNPSVYEIAVGRELLPKLFQNFNIFFVENKDERYYAQIGLERTIFPGAANKYAVFQNTVTIDYKGIIDRDFLSDEDLDLITAQYPTLYILKYYCIENYLFHPDNLQEYYNDNNVFNSADYITQLIDIKKQALNEISLKITTSRLEYPFFKEPRFEKTGFRKKFLNSNENQAEAKKILDYLQSDDPNSFLKVLSLKDYGRQVSYRQNIPPTDLAKTNWFKEQIASIINKKG